MNATQATTAVWTKRPGQERGGADHGWLQTHHSFSFADYYDPRHQGFRTLRVINEDFIAPGGGFGTHPHRDMEIFSYVLEGALEHRDSMGNHRVLRPGQIQLMSAGRGITHSEFNPDPAVRTHMLQIWIRPRTPALEPSYTEWQPSPATEQESKVLLISADGRQGSATIHQDAQIYRLRLAAGESVSHDLADGRGLWLQVLRGTLTADGLALSAGDGASTDTPGRREFQATAPVEALLFDLR